MTEEQIRALAVALEASYLADGRIGRTGQDIADQYMAAVPQPDTYDLAGPRGLYESSVRLANDQGNDLQAVEYIRCKCVIAALEVAYIRGDLSRNWRLEN